MAKARLLGGKLARKGKVYNTGDIVEVSETEAKDRRRYERVDSMATVTANGGPEDEDNEEEDEDNEEDDKEEKKPTPPLTQPATQPMRGPTGGTGPPPKPQRG